VVEALIFDYGGVVSDGGHDFEPAMRLSTNLAIDQSSAVQLISNPWDQLSKGFIDVDDFWSQIEGTLGSKINDSLRDIWNTFDNCMYPRKQIQATLMSLKTSGYILGLLSDTVPPTTQSIRLGGGYEPFEFTILSCEVGLRKPDEKIYNLALSKIPDISPPNIVYIDDNPKNLYPARKLGMQTILAGNSEDLNIEIAKVTLNKAV
jgi:epoxide hydrolase-like predicted phosphatase